MVDWNSIDTVLLDMDGTLLDLHYDSFFWLEHLPVRYAEHHSMEPERAKAHILERITAERGTLNWYCVDFWSDELGVDIGALKREIKHKVAFRPHVQDFLTLLRKRGVAATIVTNAHRKSLSMKLEQTGLDLLVDEIISSHDYGLPKEDVQFWHKLQQQMPFDPERTLLIDDSLPVLRSAQEYGIRHLLTIFQPDSQQSRRDIDEFKGIDHFDEIKPEKS